MNIFTYQFDLLFKNEELLPLSMEFVLKEFSNLAREIRGKGKVSGWTEGVYWSS